MANWCFNTVTFQAESNQIKQLQSLFLNLEAQSVLKKKGQLPFFIKARTGYFFDMDMSDNVLTFVTKWVPNIEIMCQIANRYQAGFVYHYEETANGIYGEAKYENCILTDIYLDITDFARYEYDGETERYIFEGDSYEDDTEILEILLERRIAGGQ